jgi:hypothetical protein
MSAQAARTDLLRNARRRLADLLAGALLDDRA